MTFPQKCTSSGGEVIVRSGPNLNKNSTSSPTGSERLERNNTPPALTSKVSESMFCRFGQDPCNCVVSEKGKRRWARFSVWAIMTEAMDMEDRDFTMGSNVILSKRGSVKSASCEKYWLANCCGFSSLQCAPRCWVRLMGWRCANFCL